MTAVKIRIEDSIDLRVFTLNTVSDALSRCALNLALVLGIIIRHLTPPPSLMGAKSQ